MFQHILVASDLERSSEGAGRLAITLARDQGARLTFVHALPLPAEAFAPPPSYVPVPEEELRRTAEATLRDWACRLEAPPDFGVVARPGDPATVVLEAAKAVHADLVIVGTHGRSGLARAFIGSTAGTLVRLSPVPVLSVRMTDGG
jgi:nucleotide-binding universal stress UspA family protein